MIVSDPVTPDGHAHLPVHDLPTRLAERYPAGAIPDQLAVDEMPPNGCRHLLLEAGVTLRPPAAPRSGHWLDPSVIPLERQREITEAYRAFPGYEVAAPAVAYLHQAGATIRIVRICVVRRAVTLGARFAASLIMPTRWARGRLPRAHPWYPPASSARPVEVSR
jgi:hypothetical protein